MTKDEATTIAEAITKLESGQAHIAASLLRYLLRHAGHEPPPPVLVPMREPDRALERGS
jgi:hypothetical protein